MHMKQIRTVRNLKEAVYQRLRENIANGSLSPGSSLKEADLVRDLGVSRTPIREALNLLWKEGLVEFVPGKGAFVKRWNRTEIIEVLLIREVLEGLAARLAAQKLTPRDLEQLSDYMDAYRRGQMDYAAADRRFHEHIVNASGVSRLTDLIHNLYDSLQMANMLRLMFMMPSRVEDSMAEHARIIEAFRRGDEDSAEMLAREHFRQTKAFYLKLVGEDNWPGSAFL